MTILVCCECELLQSQLFLDITLKCFDIIKVLLIFVDNDKILEWNLTQIRQVVRKAYPETEGFGFAKVTGEVENCRHAPYFTLDYFIEEFLLHRRE
jgi:hypothetical protein